MAVIFHSSEDINIETIGSSQYLEADSRYSLPRNRCVIQSSTYHGYQRINYGKSVSNGYFSAMCVPGPLFDSYDYIPFLIFVKYTDGDTPVIEERFKIYYSFRNGFAIGYNNGITDEIIAYNKQRLLTRHGTYSPTYHYKFSVFFNFTTPTESEITLYIENEPIVHWTGDSSEFSEDGTVNATQVYGMGGNPSSSTSRSYWMQFIVSEGADDISHHYESSFGPISAGTYTDMTGGISDINSIVLDDETYITSSIPGESSSFMFKNYAQEESNIDETVLSLAISARCRVVGTGPTQFRFFYVLDNTKYYSNYYQLTSDWKIFTYKIETRPDNNEAWTTTDLESIEVGIESG